MTEIEEAETTRGPEKGLHLLFVDGAMKANPPGEDAASGAIAAILKDPGGQKVLAESSGCSTRYPIRMLLSTGP